MQLTGRRTPLFFSNVIAKPHQLRQSSNHRLPLSNNRHLLDHRSLPAQWWGVLPYVTDSHHSRTPTSWPPIQFTTWIMALSNLQRPIPPIPIDHSHLACPIRRHCSPGLHLLHILLRRRCSTVRLIRNRRHLPHMVSPGILTPGEHSLVRPWGVCHR